MSSIIIRKYLTQDFNDNDKKSYIEYIKGNQNSNLWIEKALIRREALLQLDLKCDIQTNTGNICDGWINIDEKGICKCSNSHYSYDKIIKLIETLK